MKNIVITGANRGIGLELTKLYSQSDNVTAICRQSSNELKNLPNVNILDSVELDNFDSISKGLSKCPDNIDLLINNAGVLDRVSLTSLDPVNINKINYQFQVNALAPVIVVNQLLNKFSSSAKIVLVTSRMGSIGDNSSGSHYGYRMSKAALNMAGKSLSIDLKDNGIAVGIIHPGWVKTDMTGHTGHYTVDKAATQIIDRINELNESNTGTFWHSDGQILSW